MDYIDMHSHAHALSGTNGSWPAGILCCGTNPSDWGEVRDWCQTRPQAYAGYGVHPWFAETYGAQTMELLEQYLSDDPHAGVGEIGLHRGRSKWNEQQQSQCFRDQLQLGCARQRWITIHCVQAWGLLLEHLDAVTSSAARILVHDFMGSVELARVMMKRGVYLSFRVRPDSEKQARIVKELDPHYVLVESDADGGQGQVCYDVNVVPAGMIQMAQWREEDPVVWANIVYANSLRFLGL